MLSTKRSTKNTNQIIRYAALLASLVLASSALRAEERPAGASLSNPFVMVMVILMVFLALAIAILANVVLGAAQVKMQNEKKDNKLAEPTSNPTATITTALIGLMLLTSPLFAQDKSTTEVGASSAVPIVNGLSETAFYLMTAVIFLEMAVILALLYNLKLLLETEKKKQFIETSPLQSAVVRPKISWWDRLNKFRPLEQEQSIDLGHNYDGIRELDNRLPPWWLYGFYATILFACIYLWRYHVAHSAPLSAEEYQISMQKADVERAAYLKNAAASIDETNVKLLNGPSDLDAGKAIFETTCFPCHGKSGEGLVGPNLTDDYWLHGGSISDIFKTIKYGYPEKGMKSWKDDYSPMQIAQLASYIKSLRGTNPPNAKPPQGTLFNGDGGAKPPPSDTVAPGKENRSVSLAQ
jgi:cytochrome c oxidase cbb3-type subunit III